MALGLSAVPISLTLPYFLNLGLEGNIYYVLYSVVRSFFVVIIYTFTAKNNTFVSESLGTSEDVCDTLLLVWGFVSCIARLKSLFFAHPGLKSLDVD